MTNQKKIYPPRLTKQLDFSVLRWEWLWLAQEWESVLGIERQCRIRATTHNRILGLSISIHTDGFCGTKPFFFSIQQPGK